MKKNLIIFILILTVISGKQVCFANEKFEPTHKNTTSGKEYGIKEEYRVRKLDNKNLEIEIKKGVFVSIDKNEISKFDKINYNFDTETTKKLSNNNFINNTFETFFKEKFITHINTIPNFPYSTHYEEYFEKDKAWYGNKLTLKSIVQSGKNEYTAIYGGILYFDFSK